MIKVKNRWQNESLDVLQDSMDYTNVLSTEFKQRILSYVHWIGTNAINYQDDVIDSINELVTDMKRVSIFSDEFISFIGTNLKLGLKNEIAKLNKNYPISINGKVITNIEILSENENEIKDFVLSNETVKSNLKDLTVTKVNVFKGKMVNIVTL